MKTSRVRIAACALAVTLLTALATSATMGQEPVVEESARSREMAKLEDRSNWALQEKDQAIGKAQKILGIADRMGLPSRAEVVFLAEDNTPFLSEQIIARPVWHVVIRDWKLELKSAPPDVKDSYTRTFDVFVDPLNGHLLKIVSRWPEGVRRIPPEPRAASFTKQMRGSGSQRYHALPEEDPAISFLDALDGMFQGGVDPLIVEQIVGQYVVWSRMGRPPKPVWVITLRATGALWESAFPGGGVNGRNHLRYVVDPQTGKWICGSSVPQPEDKPASETGQDPQ